MSIPSDYQIQMLLLMAGLLAIPAGGWLATQLIIFLMDYVFVARGTGWRRPRVRFELEGEHLLRQYVITKSRSRWYRSAVVTEDLTWSVDLSKVRFASAATATAKFPAFIDLWYDDPKMVDGWDNVNNRFLPASPTAENVTPVGSYAPWDMKLQPEIHWAVVGYLRNQKIKGRLGTNVSLSDGEQVSWYLEAREGQSSVFA